MKSAVTTLWTAGLLALVATAASAIELKPARVLDDNGWMLRVAPDSTTLAGSTDGTQLQYKLLDRDGLPWFHGTVPGTEDDLQDRHPQLSRNPKTGHLTLVWSRERTDGLHELVLLGWAQQSWQRVPDGLGGWNPAIVELGRSSSPIAATMLHDSGGSLHVTWVAEDSSGIHVATVDESLELLGRDILTDDDLVELGAPLMRADGAGNVFVAHLGRTASGTIELNVLASVQRGGGVNHLPNPVIELGRVADLDELLPTSMSSDDWEPLPELNISVLSGVPTIWWLENTDRGQELVHVSRSGDSWSELATQRLSLVSLELDADEALQLIEARFRQVAPWQADESDLRMPGIRFDPEIGRGRWGGSRRVLR
ncbi:MAG: hypothetical protein AAF533_05945 [Acidobacteriota bacterium]